MTEREAYDEMCAYTLTLGDAEFIHQQVVDAYAAQTANSATKPIALSFALIGLYLHLEKGFTGREAQLAHIYLARRRHAWPILALPVARGDMKASHVFAHPAGAARAQAIHAWCEVVWQAFHETRDAIVDLWLTHGYKSDAANDVDRFRKAGTSSL